MNIQLVNSFLKAKTVFSCIVKYTPKQEIIKKAFWPWGKSETKEIDTWTLEIKYLGEDDIKYTFTKASTDYNSLKTQFDSVMTQIRDQDNQYADRLLEDAIINGGTK